MDRDREWSHRIKCISLGISRDTGLNAMVDFVQCYFPLLWILWDLLAHLPRPAAIAAVVCQLRLTASISSPSF